ncbi:hypothetical protein [Ruania albidiflava]|uniref:hypothetical protein n=1 Tax=Ruania albidiflava TaxID=366586 RepID=UPI0003B50779|nr:hypothetical protein [Ruania albidiflava]
MRQRLCTVAALAGLAIVLLAGCGEGDDPQDDATTLHPTSSPAEPGTDPSEPAEQPTDDASPPAEDVQAAIDDLAQRIDVPAADIESGALEPVTWPDGSLGCPSPGQAYPQVLTDGYRLVLTAGGQEYEYHAGADGELFYCEDPSEPADQDVDRS